MTAIVSDLNPKAKHASAMSLLSFEVKDESSFNIT